MSVDETNSFCLIGSDNEVDMDTLHYFCTNNIHTYIGILRFVLVGQDDVMKVMNVLK